jgi:hypothetical protein
MLADDGPGDVAATEAAAAKLEALSLLHRFPDGALLVHRWTAQGLAALADPATHLPQCIRTIVTGCGGSQTRPMESRMASRPCGIFSPVATWALRSPWPAPV